SHENGSGMVPDHINWNTLNLANTTANSLYGNPANLPDPPTRQAIAEYMRSLGPRQTALPHDQLSRLSASRSINTTDTMLSDTLTFRNIFGYQRMKQQYACDLDGGFLPIMGHLPGFMPTGYEDIAPAGAALRMTDTSLITEEPQLHGNFLDDRFNLVVG